MDRSTSLAVLLLIFTSAGACTDRIAGPAGRGPSPQVRQTLQAAETQDGPAVVLESRDEQGAETRAVGGNLTAQSTQPTGPVTVFIHPNGGYRGAPSRRQIHNADPTREVRFTITCVVNGTPQSVAKVQVDSVRQRNYGTPVGGHGSVHNFTNTGAGRPRGRWNPASGEAPGGVFVSTVTAEIASGDEKIAIWYKVTDPASPCDGLETSKEFRSVVRVPGLVPVAQDTNIALSPPSSNHPGPSFWYLASGANAATVRMAAFHRKDYGTPLLLTAAALAQGGINDIENNWSRPHSEHRVGMEIDIDDQAANNLKRLREIAEMGERAGFAACELHGDPHNHVHCRLRAYN